MNTKQRNRPDGWGRAFLLRRAAQLTGGKPGADLGRMVFLAAAEKTRSVNRNNGHRHGRFLAERAGPRRGPGRAPAAATLNLAAVPEIVRPATGSNTRSPTGRGAATAEELRFFGLVRPQNNPGPYFGEGWVAGPDAGQRGSFRALHGAGPRAGSGRPGFAHDFHHPAAVRSISPSTRSAGLGTKGRALARCRH